METNLEFDFTNKLIWMPNKFMHAKWIYESKIYYFLSYLNKFKTNSNSAFFGIFEDQI